MKNRLKEIMLKRGLTPQEVADKLGVKKRTFNSWYWNARQFDYATAFKLKEILKLDSIEQLMEE